jgi:sporulation protein YlmC with PRC-barrel domain
MDIPINATVSCNEGPCGESTIVILDPTTEKITHVVVKEKRFPNVERLVPLDIIKETTPNSIQLNCSKNELAKMDEFIEHRYIYPDKLFNRYEANQYVMWPYVRPLESHYIDIHTERVPFGELAIHRGTKVQALDGQVGKVDEFLIDPNNRHVTHLILRKGHLWGQKEVTIPVDQVDQIADDTVYLKLDKSSIEALPTIPVKRWI